MRECECGGNAARVLFARIDATDAVAHRISEESTNGWRRSRTVRVAKARHRPRMHRGWRAPPRESWPAAANGRPAVRDQKR
ncbi:hypothetical protein WT81_06630 [Burkholderia stagnalis]|nr:hypothetical protein WT80_31670 [Burkholderia stagnalis]KWK64701.1 hypothetical protein WT81_06630 [Burkholderia stagnalis]